MSEVVSKLRSTLSELQRELVEVDPQDPEVRALLSSLESELRSALGKESSGPAGSAQGGLLERLREAAERLEASHPDLSANVGGLIDALSRMGI